jgi:hypothetical protein
MDPLNVAGYGLALCNLVISIYVEPLLKTLGRFVILRRYCGTLPALFLNSFCIELRSVETELLLDRNDEDARTFKQSQHEDCNMTAVAFRNCIRFHSYGKQPSARVVLLNVVVAAMNYTWLLSGSVLTVL